MFKNYKSNSFFIVVLLQFMYTIGYNSPKCLNHNYWKQANAHLPPYYDY